MKRTLTSIAAAGVVLGSLVPVAFAATTNHTVAKASAKVNYNHRAVTIGSYKVNVNGIAAKDGAQNTEFLPVWYLQQGLKSMGYTVTWDGNNMILNIQTPTGATVDTTNPVIGTGDMAIQLNGTMVQSAPHMVAKDPASGVYTTYVPVWYLEQVLTRVGFINNYNGAAGTWTEQTNDFAVSGVVTGLSIGTKDALSLTSKTQTVDASKVTWSVDGNGAAVIDANGNFIASAGGTYNVTAKYEGVTATAKVVVYGQAVGYKVTSSAASLIADGTSYNTITVTAVDANGNPVANYNGTAAVTDTAGLIADATGAKDQPSDFSAGDITFTNGVATFAVGPTTTIGTSDTVTVADTNVSTPLTPATYTMTTVSPVLSQLALAVTSGSPSAISANGQTSTTLTLSAENTAGNTFAGQPGQYVTLSLTGPGSFVAGTTATTSETVYVPTSGTLPVTVYSMPGQAGSIVVSAAATGLTSATLTVPSYINTAAGSVGVTSTTGTDSKGNAYTLYTVQLLDTNGHPITGTTAADAFTVTDNSSAGSGVLQYGTVDSSGNFTGTATSATGITNGKLVNGTATFAVETNTVGTGTPTITVNDTTNSLTKTATYSYAAGAATTVAVTPNATYYTAKAGQTVTFTAQLQDTNGNNVAQANQPVAFKFVTNSDSLTFPTGQATYTVDTNASGVATVSFALPNTAGLGSLEVSATPTNITGATAVNSTPVAIESTTNTGAYATQVGFKNSLGNAVSSVSTTAKTGFAAGTVEAMAENLLGSTTGVGNDDLQLTSSNTNVVSVPSAAIATSNGSVDLSSDLTIGTAGSAVITVQDISNPDMPKATFVVNVSPSAQAGAVVEYNGALFSATNTDTLAAGGNVELQVVNADAAGDPLPVVGSSAVTVNLSSTAAGDFRLTPTGAPVTSVTINPGQSSVPVYFVSSSSTAETLNSSAQFTATEVGGALFSMSGLTYGTETGTAAAGGSFAVATPATGKDVNGYSASATGGTYTISGTPATSLVSINAATGAVTIGAGATIGNYTVTYTVGTVTTTATITVA